jgi:hypothetical protein
MQSLKESLGGLLLAAPKMHLPLPLVLVLPTSNCIIEVGQLTIENFPDSWQLKQLLNTVHDADKLLLFLLAGRGSRGREAPGRFGWEGGCYAGLRGLHQDNADGPGRDQVRWPRVPGGNGPHRDDAAPNTGGRQVSLRSHGEHNTHLIAVPIRGCFRV